VVVVTQHSVAPLASIRVTDGFMGKISKAKNKETGKND